MHSVGVGVGEKVLYASIFFVQNLSRICMSWSKAIFVVCHVFRMEMQGINCYYKTFRGLSFAICHTGVSRSEDAKVLAVQDHTIISKAVENRIMLSIHAENGLKTEEVLHRVIYLTPSS